MEMAKTTPAVYIESLPDELRPVIEKFDKEISKIFRGKPKVLWTGKFWGGSDQNIIGYGDLNYERRGKRTEWFIVGLAAQKNYISLYVNAVEDGKYLGQKYGKELGKVKIGASSISFKSLDDVDMPMMRTMLKQAKEYRP